MKSRKKSSPNVRTRTFERASFARSTVGVGAGEKRKKGGTGGKREKGGGGEGNGKNKTLKTGAREESRMRKANRAVAESLTVLHNNPKDAGDLSKRDRLFVQNILAGMGKAAAMQLASKALGVELGESGAVVAANKALDNPRVDDALDQALKAVGIDDELIASKLKEGLDATAFTQTGLEHSDFKTRHAYIQTILRVRGQLGAEVANKNQSINYVSFNEGGEDEND